MSAAAGVQVLREVRLYGALGRDFGRVFRLAVKTPAEAVRALRAVLPGFERAFLGRDGRAAYHVFVGRLKQRRDIGVEDIQSPVGAAEPIRLVPVIAGAKRGGVLQSVLGIVLIAAGILGSEIGLGPLVGIGVSLLLGGVIQLLSPQRQGRDPTTNLPSYAFDGPINNTEQGGPVPVCYGRVICGSVVVSQGIATDELVVTAAAPAPPPPPPLPPYEPRDPGIDNDSPGG